MAKENASATINEVIDTVVFDIGNVLIPWRPETLYEKLIDPPRERIDFLSHVCSPEWNLEQDRGRTIAEAVAERIARFPQHEALIRAYYARWHEMLGAPIAGSVALLHELRAAGIRLYALTNFSAELFPYARSRFPFLDFFDGIVMSGEERLIKPDAAIYRVLFERYAVVPTRSVFIDDSLPNVDAARVLGMQAIHFQNAGTLRSALQALGLPVASAHQNELAGVQ